MGSMSASDNNNAEQDANDNTAFGIIKAVIMNAWIGSLFITEIIEIY